MNPLLAELNQENRNAVRVFLAFDLFAGRWIYLDSRNRQMSAWLVSPTLFFTLMLGPLGLLLYLAVRSLLGQTARVNAATQSGSTPVYP